MLNVVIGEPCLVFDDSLFDVQVWLPKDEHIRVCDQFSKYDVWIYLISILVNLVMDPTMYDVRCLFVWSQK